MTEVTDLDFDQRPEARDEPPRLPEYMRWPGPGPAPAHWWVNGIKVYRSYADYCDD